MKFLGKNANYEEFETLPQSVFWDYQTTLPGGGALTTLVSMSFSEPGVGFMFFQVSSNVPFNIVVYMGKTSSDAQVYQSEAPATQSGDIYYYRLGTGTPGYIRIDARNTSGSSAPFVALAHSQSGVFV